MQKQVRPGLTDEQIRVAIAGGSTSRILTHREGAAGTHDAENQAATQLPDNLPLPDIDLDGFDRQPGKN